MLDACVENDAPICYGILKPGLHVEGGIPVVKVRDLIRGRVRVDELLCTDPAIDRAYARSRLREGDLLLSIRGTAGTVARVPRELDGANITQDTARIRVHRDVNRGFLENVLRASAAQGFIRFHTIGQAVKGINIRDVRRIPVALPSLNEQGRIEAVMERLDAGIHQVVALLDAKRHFKRGLAQQLLTGKRRFKEFVRSPRFQETVAGPLPEDWGVKSLRGLFTPVTRRNTSGIGVVLTASGEHGLVNQRDYFSRSVAGDDLKGYYLLRKGEFAYNRSLMKGYPCGAIKRLEEYDEGTLSTLYICFALTTPGHDPDFFAQVFEGGLLNRQLGQIIKVGARAHGLLNVTAEDFYNVRVPVPGEPEQRAIAQLLSACDLEIDLLERLRNALDQQRRGVAELLLTGRVRVPA